MYYFPTKYSDDVLDYQVDWTSRLDSNNDELVDTTTPETVTLLDGDVVINTHGQTEDHTQIWLSGGTPGTVAHLKVVVRTTYDRIFEEIIEIAVWALP